ncbi:uracil-DNA glycosylase [Aerococcaceae bacterium zg-ZUI334]|uniref:uracil-DNA glycosylase n=1 Tax=Aerococcaceae bacterium zg-252 TaxID=2796928 RepID=UPI001B9C9254|nr:uracil-DNA glycosylase [Aerococcaceae bacterium zg-ZUI334]
MMTWKELLAPFWISEQGIALNNAIKNAYQKQMVFPQREDVFRAFELTPYDEVRVVILGQDPYHNVGQAHGLAFSVPNNILLPPSLKNIYKELADDLSIEMPTQGDLSSWARQGVLLLNTTLTVQAHQPNSHQHLGWQYFTDYVINVLNQHDESLIFVLWGKPAQSKRTKIDTARHFIIQAPHPSPLSAYRGFFGSQPFSQINKRLAKPIQWDSVLEMPK